MVHVTLIGNSAETPGGVRPDGTNPMEKRVPRDGPPANHSRAISIRWLAGGEGRIGIRFGGDAVMLL